MRRCIVTLAAFVWLFSAVRFQMCPQSACLRGCIVTLIAFVWLFSTVHFKMTSQAAFHRRCILTLVAFVWLFSAMLFKMTSQAAFHRGWKLTFVALVWFFLHSFCLSMENLRWPPLSQKISIHHHQGANVVSCVLSVPNWENVDKKRGGVSALARMVWGTFFRYEVPQSAQLSAGQGVQSLFGQCYAFFSGE